MVVVEVDILGIMTVDGVMTLMQLTSAASVDFSESNGKDTVRGNDILLAGLPIQKHSFTVFLPILLLFRISLGKDVCTESNV